MRRSLADLAAALGVDESEFKVQPDAEQNAADQRRLSRPTRAKGVDFDPFTGR